MDNRTMELRDTHWVEIVKTCNESGMTKVAWCREHGISTKTFYYHQTRIRRAMIAAMDSEVISPSVNTSEQSIIPVNSPGKAVELPLHKSSETGTAAPSSFAPDAVIKVAGTTVEISNNISPSLLSSLLRQICHAE